MHSELLRLGLGGGLLALGLAACSASQSETEGIGRREQGVVGGTPTGETRASIVYVVSEVRSLAGSPVYKRGTGTLVAPNLVLTALHVISKNPSNIPFTCDATGNDVSGSMGSLLGPTVAPEKIGIFTGPTPDINETATAYTAQIVSTGSDTICENDLAFLVLDHALDLPTVQIRRDQETALGETVTTIGYGDEESDPTAAVTRTERDVEVSAVGQWLRTFTVTEGPCEGDSGGPALSEDGQLAGVFSSVALECTGPNASAKYTDLSFFSSLIERAFEAAGVGSPSPGGGGAGGADGSEGPGSAGGAGGADAAPVSVVASGEAGQPAEIARPEPEGDSSCSFNRSSRGGHYLSVILLLGLLARKVRRGKSTCGDLRRPA